MSHIQGHQVLKPGVILRARFMNFQNLSKLRCLFVVEHEFDVGIGSSMTL